MSSDHDNNNKLIMMVWSALLILTVVEVLLAYQSLSVTLMLGLLLLLSFGKTGLIVAYFMHLRYERSSLVLTIIPAVAFCIAMMFIVFPDGLRLLEFRQ
ncbi:MAG: cytochrome C oxidase subunit IV family protein [Acidobacteriota bacterium]